MATTETKITKAMVLDMIIEANADNAVIVEYCENEKALLAAKAEKAKARAEAKRAAGNDLRDAVEEILKNATEPMTREDLLAAFENAEELELTVAKVQHQALELCRYDIAHKVKVKGEKGDKTAYVYGPATDAE